MSQTGRMSPAPSVWTGSLLHKHQLLATLTAKAASTLDITLPDALHVQQKIQFEKFAAQLLPSTIHDKTAQLSCYMQHFYEGGQGFQPCILSSDDVSGKWERFTDFLHKDKSVGVATSEGTTLEDSDVCLFLIPTLLLYPYLDDRSNSSAEKVFGLFSWHEPQKRYAENQKTRNTCRNTKQEDALEIGSPTPMPSKDPNTDQDITTKLDGSITRTSGEIAVDSGALRQKDSCTSYDRSPTCTIQHESSGPDTEGLGIGTNGEDQQLFKRTGQSRHSAFSSSLKIHQNASTGLKNTEIIPANRKCKERSNCGRLQFNQKEEQSGGPFNHKSLEKEYPQIDEMVSKTRGLAGYALKDIQPVVKLRRLGPSTNFKHPPLSQKHSQKSNIKHPLPTSSSTTRNTPELQQHGTSPSLSEKGKPSKRPPCLNLQSASLTMVNSCDDVSPKDSEFDDPFDFDLMSDSLQSRAPESNVCSVGNIKSTTAWKKITREPQKNDHRSGSVNNQETTNLASTTMQGGHRKRTGIIWNQRDPRQVQSHKVNATVDKQQSRNFRHGAKSASLFEVHQAIPDPPEMTKLNNHPKRKIAYGDYISKFPRNPPKEDSSQQTDIIQKESVGLMTFCERETKDASAQVDLTKKAKDTIQELQKIAMKQSIVGALGAIVTRLKTGMTVDTQITAILTIEKIIDIISKTPTFNLDSTIQEEYSDAIVFLESGDRIITPTHKESKNLANNSAFLANARELVENDSNLVGIADASTPRSTSEPEVRAAEHGTAHSDLVADPSLCSDEDGSLTQSKMAETPLEAQNHRSAFAADTGDCGTQNPSLDCQVQTTGHPEVCDKPTAVEGGEQGPPETKAEKDEQRMKEKMPEVVQCEKPDRSTAHCRTEGMATEDGMTASLDMQSKKQHNGLNKLDGEDTVRMAEDGDKSKDLKEEEKAEKTSRNQNKVQREVQVHEVGNHKRKIFPMSSLPEKRRKCISEGIPGAYNDVVDSAGRQSFEVREQTVEPKRRVITSMGTRVTPFVIPEAHVPLSRERNVVENSKNEIKVTLRKKTPADVKETIAVINKCLHGTEDEERRYVVVGGPVSKKDSNQEVCIATSAQSRTSLDSKDPCQNSDARGSVSTENIFGIHSLQEGCDLITSDEEDFDEQVKNISFPDSKKKYQRDGNIQDDFEHTTQSIEANLRVIRENVEHTISYVNNKSHEDHAKMSEQFYSHKKTIENSHTAGEWLDYPGPFSKMASRNHQMQTPEGKTLLEMRLGKFYKFVSYWKNGSHKNTEALRNTAFQWYKRLYKMKRNFSSVFNKRCRSQSTLLQWDGETISMESANIRLSELNIASAVANYVSISTDYDEQLKLYSSSGRDDGKSRKELQVILNALDETYITMKSVQDEFGFTKGVGNQWRYCMSEICEDCCHKIAVLKDMLQYKSTEQQSDEHEYHQMSPFRNNLKETLRELLELQGCDWGSMIGEAVPEAWETLLPKIIEHLDLENPNNLIQILGQFLPGDDVDSRSDMSNGGPFINEQDHKELADEDPMGMWHRRLDMVADSMERGRLHPFSRSARSISEIDRRDTQGEFHREWQRVSGKNEVKMGSRSDYHEDERIGFRQSHPGEERYKGNSRESQPYNTFGHKMGIRRQTKHNDNIPIVQGSNRSFHFQDSSTCSDEGVHAQRTSHRRGNIKREVNQKGDIFEKQGQDRRIRTDNDYTPQPSTENKPWERYDELNGRNDVTHEDLTPIKEENQESERISKTEPRGKVSHTKPEMGKYGNGKDSLLYLKPLAAVLPTVANSVLENEHVEGGIKNVAKDVGTNNTRERSDEKREISFSKDSRIKKDKEKDTSQSMEELSKDNVTESKEKQVLANCFGVHSQEERAHNPDINKAKISFKLENKTGAKVAERNVFTTAEESEESDGNGSPGETCDSQGLSRTATRKAFLKATSKKDTGSSYSTLKSEPTNALLDIGIEYGNGNKWEEDMDIVSLSDSESCSSTKCASTPKLNKNRPLGADCIEKAHEYQLSETSTRKQEKPDSESAKLNTCDIRTGIANGKYAKLISRALSSQGATKVHRAPSSLWPYIKHPKYKNALCPYKARCWRSENCWNAHRPEELRNEILQELKIIELDDKTLWIDVDDIGRLESSSKAKLGSL